MSNVYYDKVTAKQIISPGKVSGGQTHYVAAKQNVFQSLDDANDALNSGNVVYEESDSFIKYYQIFGVEHHDFFVLVPGMVAATSTNPSGAQFVPVGTLEGMSNQAEKYIEFDGDNDVAEWTGKSGGAEDVLDWGKSWIFGITLVGFTTLQDGAKMCLAANGGNKILIKREAGQDSLYITGDDGGYIHGANIWHNLVPGRRLLFSYDSTTNYLAYYTGDPVAGTYATRANLFVSQHVRNANQTGTGFELSKGNGGNIVAWHGGLDNMIGRDAVMSAVQREIYFGVGSDFESHEYYPDLCFYCKLGEDTYNTIIDKKGNLTGGEFKNGTASDFKDIPTA